MAADPNGGRAVKSTEWAEKAWPLLRELKDVFDAAETNLDLLSLADKCIEHRELIDELAVDNPQKDAP